MFFSRQLPQIHSFADYHHNFLPLEKITEKRKLNFKFHKYEKDKFLKIIQDLMNKMFPVLYLEKFQYLKSISNKRSFPKNPKFILTSCPPITKDEAFKFWVSSQIHFNKKLFIMQHGGAPYGTDYFPSSVHKHEIKISNKFLSWGWGEGKKNPKSSSTNYIKSISKISKKWKNIINIP